MELPGQLVEKVKQGKAVLFLGSGALFGANLPNGREIPLGDGLKNILCEKYLNESFKNSDLAHVAAMAISQASLFEIQDFIKDYFSGLEPAAFHMQIPSFKWRAIFTTNYDFLIETSYNKSKNNIQDLSVILSDEDNLDETRTTNNKLPFIKLHGCISRTHDSSLPLILTTDQYNDCYKNRSRLFKHLYELAYENTLVFIGHSLLDHNIRNILLQLEKEAPHGQRHYLLKPGVDQIETNFWAQKKISALDLTFENFITHVSESISTSDRALALIRPPSTHPIQSRFNTHTPPSDELIECLTNELEWVNSDLTVGHSNPQEFFRGVNQEWSPILSEICITRNIQNHIFETAINVPEPERASDVDFYAIKGEAGSGKSVLLRQLAWHTVNKNSGLVLWVKTGCIADYTIIEELFSKTSERIFLFWDDAATNSIEINRFLLKANKRSSKITVVSAERFNEWNVRCEEIDTLTNSVFKLRYLSEEEIDRLVIKLEAHNSLGPNLIHKNHEERCHELRDLHGRQLLVALHEATMGEPFEDIIFNEFENIYPESAKSIYLTVSTLNRLRVPVRAGLMSRIHNISFTAFSEKFYRPLEKVVISRGSTDQDIHYSARHPEIAEIVFRRALSNVEDRYQEYIRIINKLNISFESDRASFRHLIKAKSLNDLFPNHEDVQAIYIYAQKAIGDDPYLLQQIANYERIRPNGSLDKVLKILEKAKNLSPNDQSIMHSLSVAWRDKAARSENPFQRKKFRSEARSYLDLIASKWSMTGYISASMVELSLDSLTDLLLDNDVLEVNVREAIKKVQQQITENRRQYPAESHIHTLEARFARLLDDHRRALEALERSFEENDRDPYLAIRLSSTYANNGDIEKAKLILQKALDRRRSDHKLNYHYAELLRNSMETDSLQLMYYYRRGFTPNDSNYQAQYWFARFGLFSKEEKDRQLAKKIFTGLAKARVDHESKIKIRDIEGGKNDPKKFYGTIKTKRESFGFLKIDGFGEEIFFSANNAKDDLWDAMREGDRISFSLGYNYRGPVALGVDCD